MRPVLTMLAAAVLIAGGCGKPRLSGEQTAPARVPITVVVEDELTSRDLGVDLESPHSLAMLPDGRWLVSDYELSELLLLDTSGKVVDEVGGFGYADGQLNRPSFITIDNGLSILVSDEGNRRVVRYDLRLNFVESIAHEEEVITGLDYPAGSAVTEYGELWVAERNGQRIAVFDNQGEFGRYVGDFGYSGGQLVAPSAIQRDQRGDFLVCDTDRGRLIRYDSFGNYRNDIDGPDFVAPQALYCDDEFTWVLDAETRQLVCLDRRDDIVLVAGPNLPGATEDLVNPTGLIRIDDDRLLIADAGSGRLLRCRVIFDE